MHTLQGKLADITLREGLNYDGIARLLAPSASLEWWTPRGPYIILSLDQYCRVGDIVALDT